jgi:acyl transferase domain-containing protein
MMLTGGVDTDNSPFMYMCFSKTPAFSKSGVSRPLDADTDGILIGEGVGMLVMKRLRDAERDGDEIYAVVKGVGASSDGRFKSIYAPRAAGQALAVERAYEEAGFAPSTVGLIEAHGTGTAAGDPTEFESMRMVFSKDNPKKQHIALGSVKSQIAHTKAAAGAAGLVKAALALHHKVLPPTINVEQPNPKFEIEQSPLYVNTEARPWMRNGLPRRAGVSAFGFGGVNVHVVLEEYGEHTPGNYRLHTPYKTVLLSGATPDSLLDQCRLVSRQLQSEEADRHFYGLVDSSKKKSVPVAEARLGFVCESLEDCQHKLGKAIQLLEKNTEDWQHPAGIYYQRQGLPADTKVVALFSGQGSHYVGMGKELANAFPIVRQTFQSVDDLFIRDGQPALSKTLFPIPVFTEEDRREQQERLTQTEYAQPAIGALSAGMYKVLSAAGLQPAFMAGHSFGELTALWAAGAMDDETFYRLAMERGKAMAAQTGDDADTGAMLAVKADYEIVHRELADIEGVIIANVNSPNQTVVGGASHLIREAALHLDAKGFSVTPLTVSAAFHTPFVEHAQKPFAAMVEEAVVQAPRIPVFSNTTAQPYPGQTAEVKRLLQNHMLESVWFKHSIEHIHQAGGRVFVEFGPRAILSGLVAETLEDKDFLAVSLNANSRKDSDLQFRLGVLRLRVAGIALNDIDEGIVSVRQPVAKGKLNVKLNGSNYVSAETREAYEKALQKTVKVENPRATVRETDQEKQPAAIPSAPALVHTYSSEPAAQGSAPVKEVMVASQPDTSSIHQHQKETDMQPELIQLLQSALDHYRTQQDKNQELLEHYLHEQSRQFESLLAAIKGQPAPATNGRPAATMNAPAAPIETPQPKPVVPAPKAPAPPPVAQTPAVKPPAPQPVQPTPQPEAVKSVPPAPSANTEKLGKLLLGIVSEKTGYPAEMLELSMDIEADLGIDSIKRVEIFGAVKENYPEVGDVNPQALGELRTLQQIVDYFAGQQTQAAPAKAPVTAPAPVVAAAVQPQAVAPNGVHAPAEQDNGKLGALLLEIVSEKTGYPAEMLELSMDIEADLGIDSIKRVEIFGAVKENHPEVGEINPQELGELRTLQQIVDYFQRSKKGNGLSPN